MLSSPTITSAQPLETLHDFQLGDNGKLKNFNEYMNAKVSKLKRQIHDNIELKSNIFNDISIYVNGYTNPPALVLRRLIVENGGEYHHYYAYGKTTYVVANVLSISKWKSLRSNEIVIKPDWLLCCINAGKKLYHKEFLLQQPPLVQPNFPFKLNKNRISIPPQLNVLIKSNQPSIRDHLIIRKTPSPPICVSSTKSDTSVTTSKYLIKTKANVNIARRPNANLLNKVNDTKRVKKNDYEPHLQRRKFAILPLVPLDTDEDDTEIIPIIKDNLIIINRIKFDYTENAKLNTIQELLNLFSNLINKNNLMRTKALFNFLERNTFKHQNVHKDWFIVATELKNFINNKLTEMNNHILIL